MGQRSAQRRQSSDQTAPAGRHATDQRLGFEALAIPMPTDFHNGSNRPLVFPGTAVSFHDPLSGRCRVPRK